MGAVSATPTRAEGELTKDERARLENAHRRLREAVTAYDQFVGRPLKVDEQVPTHDYDKVARAQVTYVAPNVGRLVSSRPAPITTRAQTWSCHGHQQQRSPPTARPR